MLVTIVVAVISTCGQFSFVKATLSELNVVQMIENQGYICENHFITTEDGYILTFQRIPQGKFQQSSGKKNAVLLMHGLLATSAEFVFGDPNSNLAFILADLGYDVWLGNARGNSWSRNHTTLNVVVDAKQFFDFSWHEIGYYDLPAAIDYILELTNNKALHYVGHSQGGTAFLVLASTRPIYNKKIKLASLLCPAVIASGNDNIFITIAAPFVNYLEALLQFHNLYEIPFVDDIKFYCRQPGFFILCSTILYLGGQNQPLDKEQFPIIFSEFPSSSSIKQLLHYAQGAKNNRFAQYDYEPEKNVEKYGQKTSPNYDLSKITAPVAVYYSKTDRIVNYKDIKTLIRRLPHVVHEYMVTRNVGHIEFRNAKEIVNPVFGELFKIMQKY